MPMPTSWRWPVVLSGRAIRELRQLTEDNRMLDIIRTKFKELSLAQFSTDNQLTIRGTENHIPIYRARMSVDLRIIYTVDLVADRESNFDYQVIKIFSVSTRARVLYNFWAKVSRYLARYGREYRDHCSRREYVQTASGTLNIPAVFEHREYVLAEPDGEYSLGDEDDDIIGSEADMSELHEIVALEKFAPITKSLYNSILADMEAVLPMALNPDERTIVQHHGTSVVIGRSGTGKTTALIYKMRANAQLAARSEGVRPTRQLFVTRSKVLTQHIAKNYQGLIDSSEIVNKSTEELEIIRKENQKYQSRELVEFDNSVDFRVDLPHRFSELKDSHFPLFVSFDKLCEMLEGDMLAATGEYALAFAGIRTRSTISFSDFKHHYWPKFDPKLTRNLNPALVFSEILGVIKGYGRSFTMDEYLSELSHKKSPLLMDVRDKVYAIYEAYTRLRRRRYEIDNADRAQKILLGHRVPPECQVDYMQYFSLYAQTQMEAIGVAIPLKPSILAALFESKTSRRLYTKKCHGGIVRLAASLVELIYTLFPTSIDVMKPESAQTPGVPPSLFVSSVNDEAAFVHYLLDQKPIEQATPFGAQQAIIVRSESTARSLNQRLQKRCTVITLLETKGLEFDDILLYNFFAESEAPPSAWGDIFSLSVRNEDGRVRFNRLEPNLTASPILCSELKQLYVAITRARHRCWLWDSGEAIDAMRVIWEGLKLITTSDSLSSLSKFAASSKDLRQWAQRGQEFFSNGLYALAQSCFERAGKDKEATIADAYNTMTEAKATQGASAKGALVDAARKMETCAKSEKSLHTASTLWYHAATCWHGAKDIVHASRAYCEGGFYDQAAVISFEAQNMDECLVILAAHSGRMDPALVERIEEVASVHFLRERRYDALQKLFKGDLDRCIALARSLRFPTQLKELLQRNRQFEALANEYLRDGLPARAIECLLKVQKPSAIERSKKILSGYLWTTFGLNATRTQHSVQQAEDLIKMSETSQGLSDPAAPYDVRIFSILLRHRTISLQLFGDILSSLNPSIEDERLRLTLIYHHILKAEKNTFDSYATFSEHLQVWPKYTASIQLLTEIPSPSQSPCVCRILGLAEPMPTNSKSGSNTSITVPNGTFLQIFVSKGRATKKNSIRDLTLPVNSADTSIREALAEHIQQSLKDLHTNLLAAPWTQPLYPAQHAYLSIASDHPSQLTHQSRDLIHDLDLVCSALEPAKGYSFSVCATGFNKAGADRIQTFWLVRLFNAIFTPMGSVNRTGLEFLNSGCPNGINTWAEEALASLDPNKHKQTFATLLVIYLSISSELHPGRAQEKYTFPPRTKGPTRRLSGQELFAASISTLHQPGSLGRLNTVVNAFERIAEKGWSIDAMALIHLVERTTRDIILAERAITTLPWSYGGFSGLVVPLSWASSLVMHAKYPQTLRPPPTDAFARHLGVILIQLLSGIPERWKVLKNDPEVHNIESLTARLVWSISLLAINLHPAHPALPTIFNVLKAPIAKGENFTPTLVTAELAALTINPDSFPAGFNQKLCLTLLTKTLRHDELVMLLGNHGVACPAKQGLVKRTIIFDNFAHLRAILFGGSKEMTSVNFPPPFELHDPRDTSIEALPESPLAETTPHHEVDASQAHATTSLSRPETPLYFSDSQSQAEEEDPKDSGLKAKLTEEAALQRIQPAWRRAIEIRAQRRRLHEYTGEGRLYEEHRHNFPKMGKSADKRDASALYLIRGPCLSIVLGLQMLVEEMGEYLEHIEDNLKGEENLTPKDVAEIQKTNKRNRELVKGYVAKANECLPPNKPPKIIKPGNISGIRNQTKVIWDIFMAVKNSKTLPHDDDFKAIEVQISHGREVILKALDKIFHNKADKVDKAGKAKKAGKAGKVGKGGKKARKGKANKAR